LLELLVANRDILFRSGHGTVGFVAFPYLLFGVLIAPLVEVAGYLVLLLLLLTGSPSGSFAASFFLAALGYAALLSVWAVLLELTTFRRSIRLRDVAPLALWAAAEPFGYRQLMLWYRLRAVWHFMRGDHSWSATPRDVALGGANPVSDSV
jgi:hypothetical protein